MKRYYKVAEHVFSVVMREDSRLWALMGNYRPFACEPAEAEAETPLFCLEVLPYSTPLFDAAVAGHVLTDKSDADMPRIELYKQQGGWLFRIAVMRDSEVCCEMLASEDFSSATLAVIASHAEAASLSRFPVDNALMLLFAFRSASMGTLEMHASVILKDGRAFLFLGKSGTGKSTHSRQWLARFPDAFLLNDDNPILRLQPSGSTFKCMCYGSPWSGKTPCYNNLSAPVGGIVLLRQAPHNKARRLSLPEAYAAVYSSSSGLRCVRAMADGLHASVSSIVSAVSCYELECLPDTDAAMICYEACTADAGRE